MKSNENHFPEFAAKMRAAGLSEASVQAFQFAYTTLIGGATGFIPEDSIQPVADLPRLNALSGNRPAPASLLAQTVVLKLNGGLGTGMGLERAKSLLPVANGLTFLDFIVRQILHLRGQHGPALQFLVMNSFSTSQDTLDALRRYAEMGAPESLELMQNQIPKVEAGTLRPLRWPANPQLEWCPPGHGDLYPAMLGSGWLERLLQDGKKYLFVSNSDNLGAILDLDLLAYFAESDRSFLMEVAERTTSDRKGGHLAERGGKLLLRESAQCPEADSPAFQDIRRHRFFNTNNLWVRLDRLKELLARHGGFLPLPMIKNAKTADPRDKNSPAVFQLETAMGAAIECFDDAAAIVVPRTRFAPVKTTADLLALRSDAYTVTQDWRIVLANGDGSPPPAIELDGNHYKMVGQFEEKLAGGVPSLKDCRELKVSGPVLFQSRNEFRGKVELVNRSAAPRTLAAGTYADGVFEV